MSDTSKTNPDPEPFRVPDGDLDDLASTLAKTMAEVRQHGVILDRLGSEPAPASSALQPGTRRSIRTLRASWPATGPGCPTWAT
ncbi:hypothetical protein LWJ43_21190 [Streptomyces sp. JH34]|nr:hypothetical protein [Streptomyces sp. JH34]MDF6020949.1 hypothetical protein [Streptomyces sp. JH34]